MSCLKKLLLILVIILSQHTLADVIDHDGFKVSQEQINELINRLPKTGEDRIFFHWTTAETGIRWISQGHIDEGEVKFLNKPSGNRQVHGPGIYWAESSTSSSGFGEFPVVFKTKKGTPVYDDKIIKEILGQKPTPNQIALLGVHVPFIRKISNDWWVTNNTQTTSDVVYAGPHGAHFNDFKFNQTKISSFYKFMEKIRARTGRGTESSSYLKSLIHLSLFMDGISFRRAIEVAPDNPWSQFEPEHFENFSRTIEELIIESENKNSNYTQYNDFKSKMFDIYNKIGGYENFRGNEVRAGGNGPAKTFLATPLQLHTLMENPYLEVAYKKNAEKTGFMVHYFYPDALHYKKLSGKISDELYATLERTSKDKLKSDSNLFQKLTKQIIDELVDDLYRNYKQNKVIFPYEEFIQKMISIHPFPDFNGRTARLFSSFLYDKFIPFYLADFDLLVNKKTLKQITDSNTRAYQNFYSALLGEYMQSSFKNEMPLYFELDELPKLDSAIKMFNIDSIDISNPEIQHLVEKRRFFKIFHEKNGYLWDILDEDDFATSVKIALDEKLDEYLNEIEKQIRNDISNNDIDLKLIQKIKKISPTISDHERFKGLKKNIINKLKQTVDDITKQNQKRNDPILVHIISSLEDFGELDRNFFVAEGKFFEENKALKVGNGYYLFIRKRIKTYEFEEELIQKLEKGSITIDEFTKQTSKIKSQDILIKNMGYEKFIKILKDQNGSGKFELIKLMKRLSDGNFIFNQHIRNILEDAIKNREFTPQMLRYLKQQIIFSNKKLFEKDIPTNVIMNVFDMFYKSETDDGKVSFIKKFHAIPAPWRNSNLEDSIRHRADDFIVEQMNKGGPDTVKRIKELHNIKLNGFIDLAAFDKTLVSKFIKTISIEDKVKLISIYRKFRFDTNFTNLMMQEASNITDEGTRKKALSHIISNAFDNLQNNDFLSMSPAKLTDHIKIALANVSPGHLSSISKALNTLKQANLIDDPRYSALGTVLSDYIKKMIAEDISPTSINGKFISSLTDIIPQHFSKDSELFKNYIIFSDYNNLNKFLRQHDNIDYTLKALSLIDDRSIRDKATKQVVRSYSDMHGLFIRKAAHGNIKPLEEYLFKIIPMANDNISGKLLQEISKGMAQYGKGEFKKAFDNISRKFLLQRMDHVKGDEKWITSNFFVFMHATPLEHGDKQKLHDFFNKLGNEQLESAIKKITEANSKNMTVYHALKNAAGRDEDLISKAVISKLGMISVIMDSSYCDTDHAKNYISEIIESFPMDKGHEAIDIIQKKLAKYKSNDRGTQLIKFLGDIKTNSGQKSCVNAVNAFIQ